MQRKYNLAKVEVASSNLVSRSKRLKAVHWTAFKRLQQEIRCQDKVSGLFMTSAGTKKPDTFTCYVIGVCLYLFSLPDCLAAVDICQEPPLYSQLSIGIDKHSTSTIGGSFGETTQENFNFDLLFKSADDKLLLGAGHRYTVFNIIGLEPETNGHLHTFFLAFHRLIQTDDQSLRISIAPALSASSNVFRHREYTADHLQLLAAVVWRKRISNRMSFRYGICGDHRFGGYRIYPLISMRWQPHPDWTVQLGFPASQLGYYISERLSSRIRIAPEGNEWQILDKELLHHSRFVYESYALVWTFDWLARENFTVSASVGRQMHNRYEMTLLDARRVRLSGDPVTRIGMSLEWRF